MSRRRAFYSTLTLALAGLLALRLYREVSGGESGGAAGGRPEVPGQLVEAAPPERATLGERVALVGSLHAKRRVEVAPRVSGRLVEIRVDRGDRVRSGELLARIEDDEIRQQVRRAEAAVRVAHASLAQREAELQSREMELERYRNLARDGVVSLQQLEAADTGVAVSRAQASLAKAQVSEAEAGLEELHIRLDQTEILSPMDGVVGARHLDVGAQASSATPLFLLLDLSSMLTVVNVPERDAHKIEVGNAARVAVDALAGEELVGRILRVSPILDPQTRTAPVEIELENADERLKAEMFARVDLSLTTDREALLVPRDALVFRNDRQGVFVVDAEVARFRPVRTGLSEGDRVEVAEGVSGEDVVVSGGASLLQNGDRVQILHP